MLPKEWIEYLVQFHSTRDYFECHEILEEYWKERGMKEDVWVGFIQLAVGLYHERRKNLRGARKTMESALKKLSHEEAYAEKLGVNSDLLLRSIENRLASMTENDINYRDMTIPLYPETLEVCKEASSDKGYTWDSPSPMNDAELLHRHKLRDRSDVIAERNRQLIIKNNNRRTK